MSLQPNLLCEADCLNFLERIDSQVASLVYLDPIYFSSTNPLFSDENDNEENTPAQKKANADKALSRYLNWLSNVIQQAKRVSIKKGNVVIHTEPKTNSYARIIAERIFDKENVTEIVLRKPRHFGSRGIPRDEHENLILCQLSTDSTYNAPFRPFTKEEIKERFNHRDDFGRFSLMDLTSPNSRPSLIFEWKGVNPPEGKSWRFSREKLASLEAEGRIYYSPINQRPYLKAYLEESAGVPIGNAWDDLPIRVFGNERTNLPTQKPLKLLERLILTTTNEDEIVIDPFCGSGTALIAAQLNSRRWIGCDNSPEAIEITRHRLNITSSKTVPIEFQFIREDELMQYEQKGNEYQIFSRGLIESPIMRFVLNQPVNIEETRHYEFKEVKGTNPVGAIENASDEYAVAFLNCEGGRIFWGIRNDDRVTVGVYLNYRQRDEISKAVTNKLHQIQPSLSPSSWRVEFHKVYEEAGKIVPDLFVVELIVPRPPENIALYGTGKGDVFIKTDSGKKKLTVTEFQAEVIRRLNR